MKILTVTILLFLSLSAISQDERSLRYILQNEKFRPTRDKIKSLKLSGPWYYIDVNEDGRDEIFHQEKVDGIDYFVIRNHRNFPIFRAPFDTFSMNGVIHKVRLVRVSKRSKVLLVFYYEGFTEYLDFNSTARLYFVSLDDNDFSTLSMSKGPHYWHEFQRSNQHYHKRRYHVFLKDFNQDGIKDVGIKYYTSSRVYHYKPGGKWLTLLPE